MNVVTANLSYFGKKTSRSNRIVDHLSRNVAFFLFPIFMVLARSSQSTTDLLTVISDKLLGLLTGLGLLEL